MKKRKKDKINVLLKRKLWGEGRDIIEKMYAQKILLIQIVNAYDNCKTVLRSLMHRFHLEEGSETKYWEISKFLSPKQKC